MEQFVSNSEKDTIEYACNLAKTLKLGDIIILSGELGSGKTKFVQGILKNFCLENQISSPTFTIVNEYTKPHHQILSTTDVNIYHFDLYRLENIDEFYEIGGDEYFQKGICIFEWGEILEKELKTNYSKIVFKKDSTDINKRIITIEEVKFENIGN